MTILFTENPSNSRPAMNLYLPVQTEQPKSSQGAARSTIRILLLDANPSEAADLRAKLADARQVAFSVHTVSDVPEAISAIDAQRFDIILADANTPAARGLAALAELRLAAPELPIISVTANYRESEALEFMRAGAQDYLVKSRLNSAAIERILVYCMERLRGFRRNAAQYAASRVLAESENLATAVTGVLRVLCELSNCERGQFWQPEPNGFLRLTQTWSANTGHEQTGFGRTQLAVGEGVPGLAWSRSSPEWLDDIAEHQDVAECGPAAAQGIRGILAFPVRLGGETLAAIEILGRETIDSDDDYLRLLMNAGGQLGQFMARKKAEEEKEQLTKERLLILDCAAEGIYGVDLKGCITFMNRSAASMLLCTPAETLGKNSHDLFCAPASEKASHSPDKCPIGATIATQQGVSGKPHLLRRTNQSSLEAEISVFPLIESGQIKGAVVCFSDVSDRKRMEVELRHAQKLEAVGALAAGIAHEINTPIQFVGDNTRFLQDAFRDVAAIVQCGQELCQAAKSGAPPSELFENITDALNKADWGYLVEEIPKALDQALDGVNRVATIVRGMKEFSHVDRSSQKAAADLNKALESTLIVARNELKYVADVETHYGELPAVICHLGDLNQVFLNLLINASHAISDVIKGTQNKGRITVTTRRDGDWVEISIADTGTGIPENARHKVFDPFFTTKEVGKGTGQGLALARAIVVDKHGGTLHFETEMAKGTTFFIRLPIEGKTVSAEAIAK